MSIIKKIGKTYGLSISGHGFDSASASLGNITLTVDQPGAPSPITPTDSVAFEVFARAVQAAFGPDVVTAPSSMTGNTDTRHYVSLDRMVSRCTTDMLLSPPLGKLVSLRVQVLRHKIPRQSCT